MMGPCGDGGGGGLVAALPGMVAGLAMSRDGGRIAYAAPPCAPPVPFPGVPPRAEATRDPAQRPVLTSTTDVPG
jgi:hypothetical protein